MLAAARPAAIRTAYGFSSAGTGNKETADNKKRREGTAFKVHTGVISVILCASALIMPSAASEGVTDGVRMCLSTVIPSLFMLMFVSIFLTESGVSGYIAHLLSPVCSKLFGLSGCSGAAVLMSLLGGYPAGAKTVASMYSAHMISEDEAALLPLFCFGAGPAFIIGVVGGMTDPRAALLLLLIQPAVMLICGVTVRFLYGPGKERYGGTSGVMRRKLTGTLPQCVTVSAAGTADALLKVCIFVVLFSALRSMLSYSGVSGAVEALLVRAGMDRALAAAVLPVLTEVTAGCAYASRAGLPAAAFAIGFGGLSVHMQVYGICRGIRVDPLRFTFMRLYQGTVSALLTAALMPLLRIGSSAAPASGEPVQRLTASCPAGAVTLLVMCLMWTLFSVDG